MLTVLFVAFSCSNNNYCSNTMLAITSLETEYACNNTKNQMNINLVDDYMIISNQEDFSAFVSGTCQPTIDFAMYDIVIGRKSLTSGNDSIEYTLLENCETGNLNLKVTFIQNITAVVPTLNYHALVPKIGEQQVLTTEIIIQY